MADDRRTRASDAGGEVRATARAQEEATINRLLLQLDATRRQLLATIGTGTLMDYELAHTRALIESIDRIFEENTRQLAQLLHPDYTQAADLGLAHALEPIAAAGFIARALPGLTSSLVSAAFSNTVDLLSVPMQAYRNSIVTAIRRVSLGGVQADSRMGAIKALGAAIQRDGFDNAAYKAERIVRTEVGRVFSSATYGGLADVADDVPALRKGWGATNDGRTRATHRQADADYSDDPIPVDELFQVGEAQLRFPLDPLAEPAGAVAARETINCRCHLISDFDAATLGQSVQQRVSLAMSA